MSNYEGENLSDELYELHNRFDIEDLNDGFVKSTSSKDWHLVEPYTTEEKENLIKVLYRFVESLVALEQIMKTFDKQSWKTTVTYVKTVRRYASMLAYHVYESRRKTARSLEDSKLFWFHDKDAYYELGEETLKLVSLILPNEDEYSLQDLRRRIRLIKIPQMEKGSSGGEEENDKDWEKNHKLRLNILQNRLLDSYEQMYPELQYEIRFFFTKVDAQTLNELRVRYLDTIVVHHNHYFPNDEPIGHAHQLCNIKCFQKGLPPAQIYVHNMTGFDCCFILRMLPNNVLARKGKNQEREWSVISPKGNKNKVKLLITPFGRFTDSMNFFNNSLENMAKEMTREDLIDLYKLHYTYFERHPTFKAALKRRADEGEEFNFVKFKEMFRGKLLFPYQSMNDLDWLMIESDNIPPIEEFRNNVFGKEGPTQEAYNAMNKIYHYFECETMSDLLHIYTLEDGMLLACIMSNTFVRMYDALGLDPTNFTSTAKYSYVSAKRLTNMSMQTIPNARVFDCIVKMKRAGFSMTKKQIAQCSPFKSHVETCEFDDKCQKCMPFTKPMTEKDAKEFRKECRRVVKESKKQTLEFLEKIICDQLREEKSKNTPELEKEIEDTQRLYETLKDCAFQGGENLKDDEEFLVLL